MPNEEIKIKDDFNEDYLKFLAKDIVKQYLDKVLEHAKRILERELNNKKL